MHRARPKLRAALSASDQTDVPGLLSKGDPSDP
jgi:hypothetical protein